ncbi:MAG: helix-turn-helix domain-containing protein [Planctomycetota bacterium]|jgi:DNA-binding transcriptional regulator YiaG
MKERPWTAARVKALRLKLGKTQNEFSEMLGVHVGTVIRWEKGNFHPSKMALKLLEAYDKN